MADLYAVCETARIQDINPGDVFAFGMHGSMFYAVGIEPHVKGDLTTAAVVYPGHPDGQGQPGIYFGNVLNGKPLLAIPKAKFLLELESARFDAHRFDLPPGSVIFADNQAHLVVMVGRGDSRTVKLVDGTYSDIADAHRRAWFSSWKLMAPTINEEWEVLAHFSVHVEKGI